MEKLYSFFLKVKKFLKKIDRFGVTFSFKYENEEKYSSLIGSLVCLCFYLIVLYVFIKNFIPYKNKENFNLQFYSINLKQTEKIKFELPTAFSFGIDCGSNETTNKIAKDLFDLKVQYVNRTRDDKGNYKPYYNSSKYTISTHPCEYEDYPIDHKSSFDYLQIKNFQCLNKNETKDHYLEGIFTDKYFSYYTFTLNSKKNTEENFQKINEFLEKEDCKLQFYYTDIIANLSNYENPISTFINSLFLQINADIYSKKNIFFMNYHLKNKTKLINAFEKKGEPLIETGYSRVENYFLYKGLDRFSKKPTEYESYARIYLRVDNKLIEIQRKYQDILEFYADTSSLLVSIFQILLFIFNLFNNYKGEYSITQKLFFFDENKCDKKNNTSISIPKNNEINGSFKREKINNLTAILENQQSTNTNKSNDNSFQKVDQNKKTLIFSSFNFCQRILLSFNSFFISIVSIFKKDIFYKEKRIIQKFKQSLNIFDNKLDIFIYIRSMILLDIMHQELVDEYKKKIFNFESRSLTFLTGEIDDNNKGNEIYKSCTDLNKNYNRIYREYFSLKNNKEIN